MGINILTFAAEELVVLVLYSLLVVGSDFLLPTLLTVLEVR